MIMTILRDLLEEVKRNLDLGLPTKDREAGLMSLEHFPSQIILSLKRRKSLLDTVTKDLQLMLFLILDFI